MKARENRIVTLFLLLLKCEMHKRNDVEKEAARDTGREMWRRRGKGRKEKESGSIPRATEMTI